MHPPVKFLFCVLLTIGIAACAAPTTKRSKIPDETRQAEANKQLLIAADLWIKRSRRLQDVAWPIRVHSADLCGEDVEPIFGITAINLSQIIQDFRGGKKGSQGEAAMSELYRQEFGITETLSVLSVAKGSPADQAGLLHGDEILRVNTVKIPKGKKAAEAFNKALETNRQEINKPVRLLIKRAGIEQNVEFPGTLACAYPVKLVNQNIVNAFADGKRVYITSGMMRFTEDDTELGLVVGHEQAHNSMAHIDKKTSNATFGSILDIAIAVTTGVNTGGLFGSAAASAYSQDFESEADYVGLYMLARTGADVTEAPGFWRRMAAEHPGNIKSNHSASHPATPERFLELEQTVKEIQEKIATGQPLVYEKQR